MRESVPTESLRAGNPALSQSGDGRTRKESEHVWHCPSPHRHALNAATASPCTPGIAAAAASASSAAPAPGCAAVPMKASCATPAAETPGRAASGPPSRTGPGCDCWRDSGRIDCGLGSGLAGTGVGTGIPHGFAPSLYRSIPLSLHPNADCDALNQFNIHRKEESGVCIAFPPTDAILLRYRQDSARDSRVSTRQARREVGHPEPNRSPPPPMIHGWQWRGLQIRLPLPTEKEPMALVLLRQTAHPSVVEIVPSSPTAILAVSSPPPGPG